MDDDHVIGGLKPYRGGDRTLAKSDMKDEQVYISRNSVY